MNNRLIKTQTRLNTRNNRLVLNTNGGHCCCGPDTMATLFRGCCNENQTIWLLSTLLTEYVSALNYRGACFIRTNETASITDLDSRNVAWFGELTTDFRLLNGACATLAAAGFCPDCEPPTGDCCIQRTKWPCRRDAITDAPFESAESRCCVLGNYHRFRVNETAYFVQWGAGGSTRVSTYVPRLFDINAPLVREDATNSYDVQEVGACRIPSYYGRQTYARTRTIYVSDGLEVIDDFLIPRNPRFITDDADRFSGDTYVSDPLFPRWVDLFVPGGYFGLWLPERVPTPNPRPLYSICDGLVHVEQDLDFDGTPENIGDWFVRGNIQCLGGSITYGYDFQELDGIDSFGARHYRNTRMRWNFEWSIYDVDYSDCDARECSELGRPGPDDKLVVLQPYDRPGAFPTCRACRQQPGL